MLVGLARSRQDPITHRHGAQYLYRPRQPGPDMVVENSGRHTIKFELKFECAAGKKVTLLATREGGQVSFRLREGVGDWVDRAPWRIEWGGGSSVENPHYQRVHYCQLLVRTQ